MEALVKALREGPALLTVSRDGQQFNVKVDARPVSEKTLLPRIPTACLLYTSAPDLFAAPGMLSE